MRAETRSARVRVVDPVCYQVSPLSGGTSQTGYARVLWWSEGELPGNASGDNVAARMAAV